MRINSFTSVYLITQIIALLCHSPGLFTVSDNFEWVDQMFCLWWAHFHPNALRNFLPKLGWWSFSKTEHLGLLPAGFSLSNSPSRSSLVIFHFNCLHYSSSSALAYKLLLRQRQDATLSSFILLNDPFHIKMTLGTWWTLSRLIPCFLV